MKEEFERTAQMFGEEAVEKLCRANVAVFGLGGVGGYAAEALARAGIGKISLIDGDRVAPSNINRQLIATNKTVGKYKADSFRDRIADINPDCDAVPYNIFFTEDQSELFDFSSFDYVVDCIDSVKDKLSIIRLSKEADTPVISAMGAGNKADPTMFCVSDISKTSVCPLAKAVRTRLRRMGIEHLKVVYSKEEPINPGSVVGSNSFTPGVMGLIIAGEVIKDIINFQNR